MRYNSTAATVMLVFIAGVFGQACATSMTYGTHPQTLEQGQVQGGVMMQTDVSSAPITTTLNAVESSEQKVDNGEDLSDREFRQMLDSAIAWLLFKPSVATEANLRVGIIDGLDAGIRYNGSTTKLDAKGRLWQSDDQTHVLSLTGGVGRQSGAVSSVVEYLALSEFSRWDADLALMYGAEPFEFLRAYAGPRFVYSWIEVEPKISDSLRSSIPEEYQDWDPSRFFQDENLVYLGGTAGLMVGYKWVWATLEATVMHTSFEPKILGEKRDLSGWLVAPVAGLILEF